MKHPEREEWIPWVCGEADRPTRARLQQHLAECPACRREVAGWQRSLDKLDRWELPGRTGTLRTAAAPVLKWAMAALVVLGLGIAIGRASARDRVDLVAWRQGVEAAVRASVEEDITRALRELRDEQSQAIAHAESRATQASQLQSERVWQNVLDTLAAARAEDAQGIRAVLQDAEDHHDAQLVSVRKDLETLATMTDEEIRQARLKLFQLAAINSSNP